MTDKLRLYYSTASPFARKVLVAAHELGLFERIELVSLATNPVAQHQELASANPLARIPTLVTPDAGALYDSRVILAYLDEIHGAGSIIPSRGAARFAALRREALADGIMDTLTSMRYETFLRPEALRWAEFLLGQHERVLRSIKVLEAEAGSLQRGDWLIGEIAVASLLGYLDFRFPDIDCRSPAPVLAAWYLAVTDRPSIRATMPS